MQLGPIKRDVYVRPPPTLLQSGILWKLARLPYGILAAGRRWLCADEQWLTETMKLRCVLDVDQLFYKRKDDGSVSLFVAKVVHNFIVAGFHNMIQTFLHQLYYRFMPGSVNQDKKFKFLGCKVNKNRNQNTS